MTEQGPQVAVGAVIVRDDCLLMVQRANDPGRGLWSVPGGRIESGEYIADALKREVKEETGLTIDVDEMIGFLEVVGQPHYVILDFLATVVGTAEPVAGGDAAAARWVPLKQVEQLDCTPRFVETLTAWGVPI
jgi:ADP-ribose pyrophosphatase YjhB (NUDIX family)